MNERNICTILGTRGGKSMEQAILGVLREDLSKQQLGG